MKAVKLFFWAYCLTISFSSNLLAGFVLNAPSGLSGGDRFRIIYVTQQTTTAIRSDIEYYNAFVQTNAHNATFQGRVVNWKAIGSTGTVSARDNVGSFGLDIPIFLVDGTRIADNLTNVFGGGNGLWAGSILNAPNRGIDGSIVADGLVWTGSTSQGLAAANSWLGRGRTSVVTYGSSGQKSSEWSQAYMGDAVAGSLKKMYGLSEILTVIPEPSAVFLFSFGSYCFAGLRHRRTVARRTF